MRENEMNVSIANKKNETHLFLSNLDPPKQQQQQQKTGRLAPRPPLRHRPRPAGPRRPGVRHARVDEGLLHGQGHPRRQRGDLVLRGRADVAGRHGGGQGSSRGGRRPGLRLFSLFSSSVVVLLPRRRPRRLGHARGRAPGARRLRQARVRLPRPGRVQGARRSAGALLGRGGG